MIDETNIIHAPVEMGYDEVAEWLFDEMKWDMFDFFVLDISREVMRKLKEDSIMEYVQYKDNLIPTYKLLLDYIESKIQEAIFRIASGTKMLVVPVLGKNKFSITFRSIRQ